MIFGYLNIFRQETLTAIYDVDKLAMIALSSDVRAQGEPLSALARMANGEHKSLTIRPQDT